MFSLQTIFGSGKQFFALLDEAAEAAHDSTRALYEMLKAPENFHGLDAFKLARQRERVASDKINQALVRISESSYGYCEESGEPIGLARLLARPTATLSVEAQSRRERLQKMYAD